MTIFEALLRKYAKKHAVSRQKVEEKPKQKVYGSQGRLEIPSLGISVPLYDTSAGGAQKIVDDTNSAVMLRWPVQRAIVDHSSQSNFKNLNNIEIGITTMVIDAAYSKTEYVCVESQIGHIKIGENGSNQIYNSKWKSPYNENAGGICIYTCIEKSEPDVMDIRLTYWQPIKK